LKSALKIFHHKDQLTWDEDLPWLGMAFNYAVHESTKVAPDKLFLGRGLGCPLGVQWNLAPEIIGDGTDEKTQLFWTRAYANLQRARGLLPVDITRTASHTIFKWGTPSDIA
jgi:hypothetical protein